MLKWKFVFCLLVVGSGARSSPALATHARHPAIASDVCPITVYYSPHGGGAAAIIDVLKKAQKTIYVAAYGLNQAEIVSTLIAAENRGIEVSVKTDKVQSAGKTQKAAIGQLRRAGVSVQISNQSRLLHDTFAVIDQRWVVTGSFNWTKPAEDRNRENLLILDCPGLAGSFINEWKMIIPNEP